MPDLTHSPTAALVRDIWQRNRTAIAWLTGIMLIESATALAIPVSVREGDTGPFATELPVVLSLLNWHSVIAALVLVFVIFGYTEHDKENSVEGFPRRLFTLPVTSFRLMVVPMLMGTAAMEVVYGLWLKLLFPRDRWSLFIAVLFGSYMVFYQTFIWTIGGSLGAMRLVVLGVAGCIFFAASIEPTIANSPYSEESLTLVFSVLSVAAFFFAWISIARQRSGGGEARLLSLLAGNARLLVSAVSAPYMVYRIGAFGLSHVVLGAVFQLLILLSSLAVLVRALLDYLSDRITIRTKPFRSAATAQFWFEWHRSGFVLPLIVGGLIFGVIGPLSWYFRDQPELTSRALFASFLLPILLAAVIGKAFSKPDFWSEDLSVPVIVAVRPLATVELVAVKVRVAAVSAAISWLLVLTFLSLWLPVWASPRLLQMLAPVLVFPQLTALSLFVFGFILTWRFLVISFWLGLSGASKVFALTAVPYAIIPIIGSGLAYGAAREHAPVLGWLQSNLTQWGSTLEWIAVIAIIAKIWLAVSSFRRVGAQEWRAYLIYWIGGIGSVLLFAVMLWQGIRRMGVPEVPGIVSAIILIAFLAVPLGRLSLAPITLAKNRHR